MHLEKKYVSEISDTYQNFMIHIKIYDTYQKFLIHIRNFLIHISFFWYISEISDTYQNFMIHIKILWYISEISDTYQKFLIHIRFFWYISEISEIYFFLMIHIKILWYISEISDTYVFGCQNLIGIRISDTHQSWGHNMCKKSFKLSGFGSCFQTFYTYCAHSSCLHYFQFVFSNMSWTIKQHASTSHLHMHFKTKLA